MLDVRTFTVGPLAENCYFVRRPNASDAVVIDPGAEAPRLIAALTPSQQQQPVAAQQQPITELAAILITHTHFDHVGAVKALHDATGAPVYVPAREQEILANINAYVPPGLGIEPLEPYQAEHSVSGGETLELAGLTLDVRFTPGHSPGHVTYVVRGEAAIFSGDVLFRDSVGRTDLPGGDWPTLLDSIRSLIGELPAQSTVYPGHMGITTLARERAQNPFLRELALT